MQRQLEVMAKKGESLDTLKQRRKTTHQKAEETAHQLNKMNPDNEYYSMHAEALKRLRKDVRKMDEDIRLDEIILIDHKQTATKVWMRLTFGGLHEWSIWHIRVRWTIFGRRRRRDTSFSESNAGPSRF